MKWMLQLPYDSLPSTTVVTVWPFRAIFVTFERSADREYCFRVCAGDVERTDERDDDRGNELRPSFTLNFTLNIFHLMWKQSNWKVKWGFSKFNHRKSPSDEIDWEDKSLQYEMSLLKEQFNLAGMWARFYVNVLFLDVFVYTLRHVYEY